jgi:hypothetical protein
MSTGEERKQIAKLSEDVKSCRRFLKIENKTFYDEILRKLPHTKYKYKSFVTISNYNPHLLLKIKGYKEELKLKLDEYKEQIRKQLELN